MAPPAPPPVPGSAVAIRAVADAVEATGLRLGDAAATLVRLRDGAVWDGPAGEAFGARIAAAPSVLDRAARRFLGAVGPLRTFAAVHEEAQAAAQRAIAEVTEAWDGYLVLEERAAVLVGSGLTESAPEMLALRHAQQDEMATVAGAEARHRAAMDRLEAADARCAGVLVALADDDISDTAVYRGLRTLGSVGHGVGYVAMVPARVAPELAVVGVVGDAVGTVADGALLLGYDEGSWRDVTVGAGSAVLGAGGRTLRNGAKAGAVVRADGTVVATAMTRQERVLAGAVRTARDRVDAAARPVPGAPRAGDAERAGRGSAADAGRVQGATRGRVGPGRAPEPGGVRDHRAAARRCRWPADPADVRGRRRSRGGRPRRAPGGARGRSPGGGPAGHPPATGPTGAGCRVGCGAGGVVSATYPVGHARPPRRRPRPGGAAVPGAAPGRRPAAPTSWPRSATTRSSSSRVRPARARRPRSPRCASSSAAAGAERRSGTPSPAASRPARSRSGSPRRWASSSAASSATRCASATTAATRPGSR